MVDDRSMTTALPDSIDLPAMALDSLNAGVDVTCNAPNASSRNASSMKPRTSLDSMHGYTTPPCDTIGGDFCAVITSNRERDHTVCEQST